MPHEPTTDLNYFFHRQQVERSRAEAATSDAAREAHKELARRYEDEIKRHGAGRVSFGMDDDLSR